MNQQSATVVVAMLALSAVALAMPQHGHSGGSGYGKQFPPKPYHFQYGVDDSYGGAVFNQQESQDKEGNVKGSYQVHLPDGRTQTVSYTADHYNGYLADVQYDGKANFGSYGPAKRPSGYHS